MKLFLVFALAGLLATGCASHKKSAPKTKPIPQAGVVANPPPTATPVVTPATPAIVTPDNSLSARVLSYNAAGRFAVLGFPIGQMPKIGQTLFLYRLGLKVAEVKITGPQRDNNIVADLISGEAQVGDEVRDQ